MGKYKPMSNLPAMGGRQLMTLVKICGIRNLTEAVWAGKCGAWAVGEVFAPSPRRIEVEKAAAINRELKGGILKVGVFVNEELEEVKRIVDYCQLDLVQLHGDETPEYLAQLSLPVIKCFSLQGPPDPCYLRRWQPNLYLFDTHSSAVRGGSGRNFNWEWLKELPPDIEFILAGGLNPGNVGMAVKRVKPMAVDVSSGVEYPGGGKDPLMIEAFISEVKEADGDVSR